MIDFKINLLNEESSHFDYDLSFSQTDSFAQRVLLTLNTWKKEFVYNIDKGIDYQAILSSTFSSRSLESFFLYELNTQLADFKSLDNFVLEFNKATGEAKVSFIAYSVDEQKAQITEFKI